VIMESDTRHIAANTTGVPSKSARRTYGKFHSIPCPPPQFFSFLHHSSFTFFFYPFFYYYFYKKQDHICLADFPLLQLQVPLLVHRTILYIKNVPVEYSLYAWLAIRGQSGPILSKFVTLVQIETTNFEIEISHLKKGCSLNPISNLRLGVLPWG